MGWQRLVGSINCQSSSKKEPYCCRALLQKKPEKLSSLLFAVTLKQHLKAHTIAFGVCVCVCVCVHMHAYVHART